MDKVIEIKVRQSGKRYEQYLKTIKLYKAGKIKYIATLTPNNFVEYCKDILGVDIELKPAKDVTTGEIGMYEIILKTK